MEEEVFTLLNKQSGSLAFKLFSFRHNSQFDHRQQNNFYTVIWVKKGSGFVRVDFTEYRFDAQTLFAFSPYQPFIFSADSPFEGVAIQFHSDFYCIHRNPQETGCDNVLFNNIFEEPFVRIDKPTRDKFNLVVDFMTTEFKTEHSKHELLVPYLKMFLVTASRIKARRKLQIAKTIPAKTPYILKTLQNAIEKNFKEKHSASDYAKLLNISPNALAKLVKAHWNKTLTELIRDRIIIEAKRELYMTNKSIKEIAWHIGYSDEFYFSRFFKISTDISPQTYRETVGFGRAEQND